ncbi:MAG: hypothetical protein F9B45_00970 [Phycisphaera sp. RhM]|nr:hypothetical protein [Phycisphaera sp. RhM]
MADEPVVGAPLAPLLSFTLTDAGGRRAASTGAGRAGAGRAGAGRAGAGGAGAGGAGGAVELDRDGSFGRVGSARELERDEAGHRRGCDADSRRRLGRGDGRRLFAVPVSGGVDH